MPRSHAIAALLAVLRQHQQWLEVAGGSWERVQANAQGIGLEDSRVVGPNVFFQSRSQFGSELQEFACTMYRFSKLSL